MDRYSHSINASPGSFISKQIKARKPIEDPDDKALYCFLLSCKIGIPSQLKEIAQDLMHLPNKNLEEIVFITLSNDAALVIDTWLKNMTDDIMAFIKSEKLTTGLFDTMYMGNWTTSGRWSGHHNRDDYPIPRE